MRFFYHATAGFVSLVLIGCSDITGCDTKTEIIELVPGEPFFEIKADNLADLRNRGWDCSSEGIRNAFGQLIGNKYTCTKCD